MGINRSYLFVKILLFFSAFRFLCRSGCSVSVNAQFSYLSCPLPRSDLPKFQVATTVAVVVVLIELWVIAWIRSRYMDTKFLRAAFEVVVGGLIVFATGILIGSA